MSMILSYVKSSGMKKSAGEALMIEMRGGRMTYMVKTIMVCCLPEGPPNFTNLR